MSGVHGPIVPGTAHSWGGVRREAARPPPPGESSWVFALGRAGRRLKPPPRPVNISELLPHDSFVWLGECSRVITALLVALPGSFGGLCGIPASLLSDNSYCRMPTLGNGRRKPGESWDFEPSRLDVCGPVLRPLADRGDGGGHLPQPLGQRALDELVVGQ